MGKSVAIVEWLKSIDLTKGFTSWHIKWPIGILGPVNFNESTCSKTFETPIEDNKKLQFSWWLRLTEPTDFLDNKFMVCFHPSDLSVSTPVICRFALAYENEDPIFTSSFCDVVESSDDCCLYSEKMEGSILKRDVNLTIHCWLDMPNDILKFIEIRRQRRLKEDDDLLLDQIHIPSNAQDFVDNSKSLYKGAIGEDKRFESLSDITLQMVQKSVNSDGQFYCHRNMLAARSSVFLSMFTTQWKEGKDRSVDIDDIKERIMKMVLYHIYTGQFLDVEEADFPDLVYAADKYQLHHLKAWLEAQLITGSFEDEDRFDHLLLAERHHLYQLRAVCIAILSSNVNVVKCQQRSVLSDEMIWAFSKRQVDTMEIKTGTEKW